MLMPKLEVDSAGGLEKKEGEWSPNESRNGAGPGLAAGTATGGKERGKTFPNGGLENMTFASRA